MTILALDTSLGALSVAVATGEPVRIVGRLERREKGHAEALFPMIEAVLAEAGVAAKSIRRIAVTEGPGGFTSVRIAIAAARGLALATGADTVTTSGLHLMALEAADQLRGEIAPEAGLVAAVDARRDEVYVQRFDATGNPLGQPRVVALTHVDDFLVARGTIVVGSGAALVAAAAQRYTCRAMLAEIVPDARRLASIAAGLVPVIKARPLYLRPPDARPQTDARTAGGTTGPIDRPAPASEPEC